MSLTDEQKALALSLDVVIAAAVRRLAGFLSLAVVVLVIVLVAMIASTAAAPGPVAVQQQATAVIALLVAGRLLAAGWPALCGGAA